MFLLRSAFWLTIGFILVAPRDADLGSAARSLGTDAVAAGQQMIVGEILKTECSTLQCVGGKAVLTSLTHLAAPTSPSVAAPVSGTANPLVPIPRPRPDWMG